MNNQKLHKRNKVVMFLLTCIIASMSLTSCDKHDINGKWDGNWQLLEWRENSTGNILATNYNRKLFYAVKLNLLQMIDYERPYDTFHLCYFHYTSDSLYIDKAFQRPFDKEVPVSALSIYGCAPEGRYAINQLTHSTLVLQNSLYTLSFRKY